MNIDEAINHIEYGMNNSLCATCKYWQSRKGSRGVCHKSVADMLGFVEHGTRSSMRNVKSKKDCKRYKEQIEGK